MNSNITKSGSGEFKLKVNSDSDLQTQGLAQLVAPILPKGKFIGLTGELGAGKTEFVRGVANYYGVSSLIASPTYVIENRYPAVELTISHWDLYRLGEATAESLDIFELDDQQDNLILIEWPRQIEAVEDLLELEIVINFGPFEQGEVTSREILFCSSNSQLIDQLAALIEG